MCAYMVLPELALLPLPFLLPILHTHFFPLSPGPSTPFGSDAQDGVAAALRKDVCAHLGHVHFCERGEWATKPSGLACGAGR